MVYQAVSFRLFGCKIYISLLFMGMLTLLLLADSSGAMSAGLLSVAVHETGHLAVMLSVRCPPSELVFLPTGISIRRRFCVGLMQELLIACGGVAANFAVILIFWQNIDIAAANMAIMLFNLLPIKGLDGYDILYLLLSRWLTPPLITRICFICGITVQAALVVLVTVFFRNPALLCCTAYLVILTIINLRC